MVRASLEGRKTMTRRPVKPQPFSVLNNALPFQTEDGRWIWRKDWNPINETNRFEIQCPYGEPGDRLWVREMLIPMPHDNNGFLWAHYQTGGEQVLIGGPGINDGVIWEWKQSYLSPRFMPHWASRITFEIVNVRVERLQEMSEYDAIKEGFAPQGHSLALAYFIELWDSLYTKKPEYQWHVNPWVWVIEFEERREG